MPSLLRPNMEESTLQETFTSLKYRPPVASVDEELGGPESGVSASSRAIPSPLKKGDGMLHSAPETGSTSIFGDASKNFNIKNAVTSYLHCCQNGATSLEMLKESVTAWIKQNRLTENVGSTSRANTSTSSLVSTTFTSPNVSKPHITRDFICCIYCQCFLSDPVTLPCGHMYCKKCLVKVQFMTCLKCGKCLNNLKWSSLKINVVVANLLSKWWPDELLSVQLRNEGNQLFQEKQIEKAAEKYSEASKLENTDHVLASNHSFALLHLGRATEALQCADRSIKLRPDWPKGYYRKGAALLSLGQYEDSVIAYLQCLTLDNDLPSVIIEVSKVLHRVISILCSSQSLGIWGRIGELDSSRCQSSGSLYNTHSTNRLIGLLLPNDLTFPPQSKFSESSGDESDTEEQICYKRRRHSFASMHQISAEGYNISKDYTRLFQFLDRCQLEMKRMKKIEPKKVEHFVDRKSIDKTDLECTLCYRLFWQPVTTPCGHVFCRVCLDRCLDHNPQCPLCKASLDEYLAERRQFVTEFIDVAMQLYIPEDYADRKQSHVEEMNELANATTGGKLELPIFVCTVGFPTVSCPLHIFEPRYRLMIRRCVESGLKKFGMCPNVEGSSDIYADFGTVLEIRDVQYFPDGRALVDAVGHERFHILQRNMKDGYHTATVEILHDQTTGNNEMERLHEIVHSEVTQWFGSLSQTVKNRILQHFGPMPDRESDYLQLDSGPAWVWWTLAILPLDPRAQLAILSMTSLRKRLEALHRTLTYILKKTS